MIPTLLRILATITVTGCTVGFLWALATVVRRRGPYHEAFATCMLAVGFSLLVSPYLFADQTGAPAVVIAGVVSLFTGVGWLWYGRYRLRSLD